MVEFCRQNPLDNREGRFVGVPPPLNEPGFDSGLIHSPGDRLSASMHHYHSHAERRHEDDVKQQMP